MLSICTNNLIMLLNYCYIDLLRHSFHRMKRARESAVCEYCMCVCCGICDGDFFITVCLVCCVGVSERFAVKYNP